MVPAKGWFLRSMTLAQYDNVAVNEWVSLEQKDAEVVSRGILTSSTALGSMSGNKYHVSIDSSTLATVTLSVCLYEQKQLAAGHGTSIDV